MNIEQLCINSIRTLGIDAINKANSGHPEYKHTDGIDATSGPLGQGIPMAVGMAMAERFLAARYNKETLI